MRYFTPQLWIGVQSPHAKATWDRRRNAYKKNLQKILPGLDSRARRFFQDLWVLHDGTLTRFEVGDRIAKPSGEGRRFDIDRRRVAVRLFVLPRSRDRAYTLEYTGVTSVDLDFPGKLKLYPAGMYPNFGDWGYDELTLADKGLFRHEILFASGATIEIEFRDFTFSRWPAEKRGKR